MYPAEWRRLLEIRRVKAAIARQPAPVPAQLVGVTAGPWSSRWPTATWRVVTQSGQEVLVKVTGSFTDTDRYVVHVHADAFYLAMLRTVRVLRTSAHGNTCMARRDMPGDYKYERAAAGFAQSATSPVPLAQPVVGIDAKGRLRVDFSDGITRTYWLLANGCRSFPVQVHGRKDAYALAERAGVGIECCADLFGTGEVHASSTAAA